MNIVQLINTIRNNDDCIVYDACGLPLEESGIDLPSEMIEFYRCCGGIKFYESGRYRFEIVSPENVVLANPVIVGELCPEDISSQWYIIAKEGDSNYITIDLSNKRAGKCYDSFWDRHGVVGECMIVANSFYELVSMLYKNKGQSIYWLEDNFCYLGDAYNNT